MPKFELLSVDSDSKTVKGREYGWITGVLYLAPSTEAGLGVDLCPKATAECRQLCLVKSGRLVFDPAVKARIRRTEWYVRERASFIEALKRDIAKLIKFAAKLGLKPAVRLNGTSDQPKLALELASLFPDVQFYDYTKIPRPWTRSRSNYHLTFSFSGQNWTEAFEALNHGVNVAVVFHGSTLPEFWHGRPVVNGDKSDLRFLDAQGVIVGLKAKGVARKAATSQFIQIAAA